ncbi:MAG TPA: SigE family RNA polymerase sigma factor [Actinomycetota bacterium]|nr:SigE family RNA polymerase sigma factor [Actinomycetota bacterium]
MTAATETLASRREALRAAFEEHYGPLVRFCTLVSGDAHAAEDLAQESFVRTAERIERVDPVRVGAYLRRAAVNLWRNRLRRMSVERRARTRTSEPSPSAGAPEERDAVWAAVLLLPPGQRACLALRYYEDLSERDTAEVLGCSIGTVKSQTSRALARLRKELSDED